MAEAPPLDDEDVDGLEELFAFLETPIDPRVYLKENWGTSDWAGLKRRDARFSPLPLSIFRLGFFDHLPSDLVDDDTLERFRGRLGIVGRLAEQGLLRLWMDLERDPGWETVYAGSTERRRSGDLVKCIQQSLDVLGEKIVRPYLDRFDEDASTVSDKKLARDEWVDGPALSDSATNALAGLILEDRESLSAELLALDTRLASLGIESGLDARSIRRRLLNSVAICPEDLDQWTLQATPNAQGADANPKVSGLSAETDGLLELRGAINDELRHLYHFSYLKEYWTGKTRQPPRIKIFVACDLRETIGRVALKTILREISAEAHRALGPIFDFDRGGISNNISVMPLLWLPHPADSIAGDAPRIRQRVRQEAVVLDAAGGRAWQIF